MPSPAERFALPLSPGFVSFRLFQLFERNLEDALGPYGVAVAQFRVLMVLWEAGEITQTEIARHLHLEQPTVANTLKRMKRDGLIETAADPTDGRRARVLLTDRGRELRDPLLGAASAVNEAACAGLDEAGRLTVVQSMTHMADRLEQHRLLRSNR